MPHEKKLETVQSTTTTAPPATGYRESAEYVGRARADAGAAEAERKERESTKLRSAASRTAGSGAPKRGDYGSQEEYLAAIREHGKRMRGESGQQSAVRKMMEK